MVTEGYEPEQSDEPGKWPRGRGAAPLAFHPTPLELPEISPSSLEGRSGITNYRQATAAIAASPHGRSGEPPMSISNFDGYTVQPTLRLYARAIVILARDRREHKDIFGEAKTELEESDLEEAKVRSAEDDRIRKGLVECKPKIIAFIQDLLKHETQAFLCDNRIIENLEKELCTRCNKTLSYRHIATMMSEYYKFAEFGDEQRLAIRRGMYGECYTHDIGCEFCPSTVLHRCKFVEKRR